MRRNRDWYGEVSSRRTPVSRLITIQVAKTRLLNEEVFHVRAALNTVCFDVLRSSDHGDYVNLIGRCYSAIWCQYIDDDPQMRRFRIVVDREDREFLNAGIWPETPEIPPGEDIWPTTDWRPRYLWPGEAEKWGKP